MNNINGEYIKFYATTNSNIPELLKDSGAMVWLQNELEQKNYLIINNNIIASGFGFKNADNLDNLTYVAVSYNGVFDYFNSAYTYMNDTLISSYNMLQQNINDIIPVVKHSDLSTAYVTSNNAYIPLSYLPALQPAKYVDATLQDIQMSVTYQYPFNAYIGKINFNTIGNSAVELPIGTTINASTFSATILSNDSGGVSTCGSTVMLNDIDITYAEHNISNLNIPDSYAYIDTEAYISPRTVLKDTVTLSTYMYANVLGTPVVDEYLKPYMSMGNTLQWKSKENVIIPHELFSNKKIASIKPLYFALYKNISDGNITDPSTYKICNIQDNNIIDIHLTESINGHYILIPDNYYIIRAYHFYNLHDDDNFKMYENVSNKILYLVDANKNYATDSTNPKNCFNIGNDVVKFNAFKININTDIYLSIMLAHNANIKQTGIETPTHDIYVTSANAYMIQDPEFINNYWYDDLMSYMPL